MSTYSGINVYNGQSVWCPWLVVGNPILMEMLYLHEEAHLAVKEGRWRLWHEERGAAWAKEMEELKQEKIRCGL